MTRHKHDWQTEDSQWGSYRWCLVEECGDPYQDFAFSETSWDVLTPLIQEAARLALRRFHQYVDRHDLEQEISLWILEEPELTFDILHEEDETERDSALLHAFESRAIRVGIRERAAALGYEPNDIFWWQKTALMDLLPAIWDDEQKVYPTPFDESNVPSRGRDPSEGNNWMATVADLSRAFDVLTDDQQWLLLRRYKDGWTQEMVAEDEGVTSSAIAHRERRAFNKMHRTLGGYPPCAHRNNCYIGARRAMSNAAAVALTERQEDG